MDRELRLMLFLLGLLQVHSGQTGKLSTNEENVFKNTTIKLSVMIADRFHPGNFLLATRTHIYSVSPTGNSKLIYPDGSFSSTFFQIQSMTFISEDTLLIADSAYYEIKQLKVTNNQLTLSTYFFGLFSESIAWLEKENTLVVLGNLREQNSLYVVNGTSKTKAYMNSFDREVMAMFIDEYATPYKFLFTVKNSFAIVDEKQNVIFDITSSSLDPVDSSAIVAGYNGTYFYYVITNNELYVRERIDGEYKRICQGYLFPSQAICKGTLSYLTVIDRYLYVQRQDSLRIYRYELLVDTKFSSTGDPPNIQNYLFAVAAVVSLVVLGVIIGLIVYLLKRFNNNSRNQVSDRNTAPPTNEPIRREQQPVRPNRELGNQSAIQMEGQPSNYPRPPRNTAANHHPLRGSQSFTSNREARNTAADLPPIRGGPSNRAARNSENLPPLRERQSFPSNREPRNLTTNQQAGRERTFTDRPGTSANPTRSGSTRVQASSSANPPTPRIRQSTPPNSGLTEGHVVSLVTRALTQFLLTEAGSSVSPSAPEEDQQFGGNEESNYDGETHEENNFGYESGETSFYNDNGRDNYIDGEHEGNNRDPPPSYESLVAAGHIRGTPNRRTAH